ncbi:response regulator [Veronia pacifica]|uniref:Response regulatory domain-containing protein n=1 Tax=Veronia pacifica TaxID=1080227 RepID=A0A1C3EDR6_9GAMM|nr:response regulator [Veronia pacifica]ODA31397.1 hypothetical protein A8L45_17130 [Veronia pacifica]
MSETMPENAKKPVILVVDDTPENLVYATELLRGDYDVKAATSGQTALSIFDKFQIDLILLDIMMPDMNGYQVCQQIKAHTRGPKVPIIFLSTRSGMQDQEKGFLAGAADFISKPISPTLAKTRIKLHLDYQRLKNEEQQQLDNDAMTKGTENTDDVVKRLTESTAVMEMTIYALARLCDDQASSGNHILRVQHYVKLLAELLMQKQRYKELLNQDYIDMVYRCVPLYLLRNPIQADKDNAENNKNHHSNAVKQALGWAEESCGKYKTQLSAAKDMAYSYTEHWDGTGYPLGLSGEDIPLSARLLNIATHIENLMKSNDQRAIEVLFEHLEQLSGTLLDPQLVELVQSNRTSLLQIARRFDSDPMKHIA